MARRRCLTDQMWAKIGPLLPEMATGAEGGRPWRDNREVLEGILWILHTGAPWADLPEGHPSPTTCWRRMRRWEKQGVWLDVWRAVLAQLDEKVSVDWQEAFLHASFETTCCAKTDPGCLQQMQLRIYLLAWASL